MGVDFHFWTEARKIECDSSGKEITGVWFQEYGPQRENSERYICDNCGAENYCIDRAFCTRCGKDTTLDKIREGAIKTTPVGNELWTNPQ